MVYESNTGALCHKLAPCALERHRKIVEDIERRKRHPLVFFWSTLEDMLDGFMETVVGRRTPA